MVSHFSSTALFQDSTFVRRGSLHFFWTRCRCKRNEIFSGAKEREGERGREREKQRKRRRERRRRNPKEREEELGESDENFPVQEEERKTIFILHFPEIKAKAFYQRQRSFSASKQATKKKKQAQESESKEEKKKEGQERFFFSLGDHQLDLGVVDRSVFVFVFVRVSVRSSSDSGSIGVLFILALRHHGVLLPDRSEGRNRLGRGSSRGSSSVVPVAVAAAPPVPTSISTNPSAPHLLHLAQQLRAPRRQPRRTRGKQIQGRAHQPAGCEGAAEARVHGPAVPRVRDERGGGARRERARGEAERREGGGIRRNSTSSDCERRGIAQSGCTSGVVRCQVEQESQRRGRELAERGVQVDDGGGICVLPRRRLCRRRRRRGGAAAARALDPVEAETRCPAGDEQQGGGGAVVAGRRGRAGEGGSSSSSSLLLRARLPGSRCSRCATPRSPAAAGEEEKTMALSLAPRPRLPLPAPTGVWAPRRPSRPPCSPRRPSRGCKELLLLHEERECSSSSSSRRSSSRSSPLSQASSSSSSSPRS